MISTNALGVSVDPLGRLVVMYRDEGDALVVVDITQVVESVAEYIFLHRATSVRAPGIANGTVANNRHVN